MIVKVQDIAGAPRTHMRLGGLLLSTLLLAGIAYTLSDWRSAGALLVDVFMNRADQASGSFIRATNGKDTENSAPETKGSEDAPPPVTDADSVKH